MPITVSPTTHSLLATGNVFKEVLPWLALLLLLVIVGGVVLMALRRSLKPPDRGSEGGYTLHDLRQMHATGALSDEEFKRAREAMIQRVTARRSENGAEEGPEKGPPAGS